MKSAVLFASVFMLAACSGQPPIEKAIIGDWVQDIPVSMTDEGLQTTTSNAAMSFEKDGDVTRRLVLTINGRNLPREGVVLDIDLSGTWTIENGTLVQTPTSTIVTARSQTETAAAWAESWQKEANSQSPSMKKIIAADRKQLILQDVASGTTDVYRRK